VAPRGGASGRRTFIEYCRSRWKKKPLLVPEEDIEQWPGWEGDPSIIYYLHTLKLGDAFDDVRKTVALTAREFFKIALPLLTEPPKQ
jgi:hypothetical protein